MDFIFQEINSFPCMPNYQAPPPPQPPLFAPFDKGGKKGGKIPPCQPSQPADGILCVYTCTDFVLPTQREAGNKELKIPFYYLKPCVLYGGEREIEILREE